MNPQVNESSRKSGSRRTWIFALVVFLVALVARLGYLGVIPQSPDYDLRLKQGSDDYRFMIWALTIRGGDLLGRGERLSGAIAAARQGDLGGDQRQGQGDPERNSFFAYFLTEKKGFKQSPLYPYLLAGLYFISGVNPADSFDLDRLLLYPRVGQMILGSLTAVLVFFLGRRLRGERAGLLAGLILALYGPMIFYESTFLRHGLIAFLNLALVLFMIKARERPEFFGGLFTGALFGLAFLGEPNILIMTPVFIWWLMAAGNARIKLKLGAGALTGFMLVMSLLVARNYQVHAPRFSFSQKGSLEFIAGNHPDVSPLGWNLSESVLELNRESKGRLMRAIVLVLQLHQDHPLDLVKIELEKTWAYLNGYEFPNNHNYYLENDYHGFFKLPFFTWPTALGLGLIGMAAGRRRWKNAFELYAYLILYSLGAIAFYFIARFRLPVVPALCVFAGAGLDLIWESAKARKWKPTMICLCIVMIVAVAVWPRPADRIRPNDYQNQVRYHLIKDEPDRAREWVERGTARARLNVEKRGDAWSHYALARLKFLGGEPLAEVRAELDIASQKIPPRWLELLIQDFQAGVDYLSTRGDPRDPNQRGFRY